VTDVEETPLGLDVDPPDLPFWATVRRMAALWRPEWRNGAVGIAAALATTALSLTITKLVQLVIDRAVVPDRPDRLPPLVALIVALALVRFGTNGVRRLTTSRIGINSEMRMRQMLFHAYLGYPRAFYDRHATGQVLSRATNDLYPVRYFIGWGVVQSIQSAMMIIGVSAVLLVVNPLLALCAGVVMPLIALLTWRFAYLVVPISRRVQQRVADVTETADEAVVGIEMVQAFGREDDIRSRFGGRSTAVRDVVLEQAGVEARYLPGLTVLPGFAIAIVLGVGGRLVIHGDLTIGQFVLFNSLLLQLVWPLEALGWILNLAQRAIASASRSFAWLEAIRPLPDPAQPRSLPDGPLGVRFAGVEFGYPGSAPILRNVSVEVEPGEIFAVCGPTGSGKTSLLNLLPRFYDPRTGGIELGGVDLREVSLHELRRTVALVTQRPVLFSAPLSENLLAGRPDASWDEVLAACDAAGVVDFVDELPAGYDTLIGERGVNLSGGQRQRVALARALLTSARILVLDDPLSAVDTETEAKLVERLKPAVSGRTVLVAAQRLSTVSVADRAVVLGDGGVVESGTPAELLRAGGPFARLFGDEVVAA
jgi:ABC-type multidrug transport system fused ATPase/permease subunit